MSCKFCRIVLPDFNTLHILGRTGTARASCAACQSAEA